MFVVWCAVCACVLAACVSAVCCLMVINWCSLGVLCLLCDACVLSFVCVCWLSPDVCSALFRRRLLFVVCCVLLVVCCMLYFVCVCCCLCVSNGRCVLFGLCCLCGGVRLVCAC